jgi:hypothetical protein
MENKTLHSCALIQVSVQVCPYEVTEALLLQAHCVRFNCTDAELTAMAKPGGMVDQVAEVREGMRCNAPDATRSEHVNANARAVHRTVRTYLDQEEGKTLSYLACTACGVKDIHEVHVKGPIHVTVVNGL